jgi:hypothetical protein
MKLLKIQARRSFGEAQYQWQNTEFCPNSVGQNGHPRDIAP